MKCIIYVSLLLIFALQIHCYPKDPEDHSFQDGDGHEISHEVPSITNYQKIAPNNADFATRLYKEIITNSTAENVFISPLSISTAFALLCLGAKAETHSQIYKGLTFNLTEIKEMEIQNGFRQVIEVLNRPGNKAKVNIGNALFINESLKVLPKFLDDVKTLYAAEGFSVNFKNSTIAKDKINNYVQNKTHGKIDNALDDLDENAVMVILNYIFFQGYWKNPFHAYMTKEEDFFVNGSTTVKVNMMFQEAYFQVLRDEDLSCWVVKMPYKGKASAWFILPDEGKMNDVEKQLQKEILTKWMTSVRNRKIKLFLPKLSIHTSYDLIPLMNKLGVKDVFGPNADLSGITGGGNLWVSQANHKAALDVHETGTEAAGVAVIVTLPGSYFMPSPPPPIIRYDHPFLMFITDDQSTAMTFLGKIGNPKSKI